jgi:hypothetical protein
LTTVGMMELLNAPTLRGGGGGVTERERDNIQSKFRKAKHQFG